MKGEVRLFARIAEITLAALLLMVSVAAFSACKPEKEPDIDSGTEQREPDKELVPRPQNCDVLFEESSLSIESSGFKNMVTVCGTYDELLETVHNNNYTEFADETVREYAAAHGDDKSFVVCMFASGAYFGRNRIWDIEVNGSELTMYILRARGSTGSLAISHTVLIAGVDKSFVAGVTECKWDFV